MKVNKSELLTVVVAIALLTACARKEESSDVVEADTVSIPRSIGALSDALTFHVSFDKDGDAVLGPGDKKVYSGNFKGQREQAKLEGVAGLGGLTIADGKGRHGGALQFTRENTHVIFYKLDKNIVYSDKNFNGSA